MHVIEIILSVLMLVFGIVGAILATPPDRPHNAVFWASLGVICGAIVLLIRTIPIS